LTVRTALALYARTAGLDEKRINSHARRAAFASRLARAGVPITVIQELMGNSNIDTTAHYIGSAPGAMREAVERARLEQQSHRVGTSYPHKGAAPNPLQG